MKKVLSFGAHPDDIEIGCGGTQLLLRDRGYAITHVCATSGEAGSRNKPPHLLRRTREAEARAAADLFGARLEMLRLADGDIQVNAETHHRVIQLIREIRPDIVFVHASDDTFADHSKAHRLVMDAIAVAAGPWFGNLGEAHRVPNIFGYEVWHPLQQPGWVVDIAVTLGRKIEILGCHASQMADVDYRTAVAGLAHYRGVMTLKNSPCEVFEVLRCEPSL